MELNRVEQIYDEIFGMSIELEPDPTVLGPRYINQVVATCRNYLNRVTAILLEIQREKRGIAKSLAAEKAGYQVELSQLLAENAAIKAAPNIKDREAQANVLLATRVARINDLDQQLLDLDTIEKTVRLRHQELVRTSDNIKTQRSLLMADRVTGSGYGDEFSGPRDGKGRPLPVDDGIDEAEITRLLAEDSNTTAADSSDEGEAPVVEAKPEPKVEVKPEPQPVVEVKPEPAPAPPPVVEAKPEPVEIKPEPKAVPDPLDDIMAEVNLAAAQAPEPKPEPVVKIEPAEQKAPEVAAPIAESEVAAFLDKEEAPKANGTAPKNGKKADKKEEKPKEAKVSPPSGDDDFDFGDILKNL